MARVANDLHEFVDMLRAAGELHEITAEVSADLEITEITDRTTKQGGPALLFSNVRGSSMPVLTNQFGSDRRLALAFGVEKIDDIAGRIEGLFELAKPARGLRGKLGVLGKVKDLAGSVPPKYVKRGACQEVVMTGAEVNLDELPILTCWPEDGGRYVTLPLVFTKDSAGARNVGMYRVQQYDRNTCGMHWQIHKDGADDWRHMPANGRLEVAVVIGSDPIVTYSASCPLPKDIDEMLFAGFARQQRVEMVQCKTVDLQVPAHAEIVLEGYVTQGELRTEGPFGDHTGYYSLADEYPVLHVTAITRRRNPIYAATVVGVPVHEDKWLAKATERIFLPLLQKIQHEVADYDLPTEGVFHGCCIIALRKRFPGHAKKAMHAVWGTALLSLTKSVIVVDEDIDVHDYAAVAAEVARNWVPERDTLFSEGPIDVLDHAPTLMGYGGKMGLDATTGWASEGRAADAGGDPEVGVGAIASTSSIASAGVAGATGTGVRVDDVAFAHLVTEHGATAWTTDVPGAAGTLAIIAIDKQRAGQARKLIAALQGDAAARGGLKLVLVVDAYIDVHVPGEVAFRVFGNVDPVRDSVAPRAAGEPLGIDATIKTLADGYPRDWPADIVMTEAIKQLVDDRWSEYGVPTSGARTKPLVGLAAGERRIGVGDTARGSAGTGNADMAREGIEAGSGAG